MVNVVIMTIGPLSGIDSPLWMMLGLSGVVGGAG
jgi:hypothetical protein